ncbi:hypothetical protein OAA62_01035 [bacterium]|nr:hypothetical protein [bacterium]
MKFKIKSPLKFDHTTSSTFSELKKVTNVSSGTSFSKDPNTTGYNLNDTVYVDGVEGTVTGIAGGNLTVTFPGGGKSTIDYTEIDYTVTINGNNGTETGGGTYKTGDTVTLSSTPDSGYTFDSWTVNSGGVTISNNSFSMPANDVTITANYTFLGHLVTLDGTYGTENGGGRYTDGETVTISALPDSGFALDSWTVNHPAGLTISDLSWGYVGQGLNGTIYNGRLGYSTALSSDGSILAVGNTSTPSYVEVYQNINETWTLVGDRIYGEVSTDSFGSDIAISSDGSVVAVGAYENDEAGSMSGSVRVYQRDTNAASGWSQLGQDIDGESADDRSGQSVSLSSDALIVAIGAIRNDGTSSSSSDNRGHTRVYEYDNSNGTWTQIGSDIDGKRAGDQSGYSTALSSDGSIVAIGAIYYDNGSETSSGHVRLFQRDASSPTGWLQIGSDINGPDGGAYSGNAVSLSSDGSIVAIGAYSHNVNFVSNTGSAQVYQRDTNAASGWSPLGQQLEGDAGGDVFGSSLALSSDGSILAVGIPGAYPYGLIRAYKYNNGTWTQFLQNMEGEPTGFANDVSISSDGSTVASSSINYNKRGRVRVFKPSNTFTMPDQEVSLTANYSASGSLDADGDNLNNDDDYFNLRSDITLTKAQLDALPAITGSQDAINVGAIYKWTKVDVNDNPLNENGFIWGEYYVIHSRIYNSGVNRFDIIVQDKNNTIMPNIMRGNSTGPASDSGYSIVRYGDSSYNNGASSASDPSTTNIYFYQNANVNLTRTELNNLGYTQSTIRVGSVLKKLNVNANAGAGYNYEINQYYIVDRIEVDGNGDYLYYCKNSHGRTSTTPLKGNADGTHPTNAFGLYGYWRPVL